MASKRRNMFQKNKTQETTEYAICHPFVAGFGLRDEGNCTCGVPEMEVGHVLLECGKYEDSRGEYVRKMGGLELDKTVGKERHEHIILLVTERGVGGVERRDIIGYCSWACGSS
ncbi:hypothetical protein AAG570_013768 [Ranatra chinensis]|uniref:Reverse transcriptase n=1 Tax=Ranatra chinensis TaxID=642074 RepID=A0ABD0Z1D9_9HEMI